MAKKKNKSGGGGGNEGGNKVEEKQKGGDGDDNKIILKVEMDCEGCASRIIKVARSFEGVETVKADIDANKVTVTGKVDPSEIIEAIHQKTKKKVDLVSPQPKKDDAKKNAADNPKNDSNKDNKKPTDKKPNAANADDKKPKSPPVTTAVLKLSFHCQGCVDRIHKTVSKTKGVEEMSFDRQKETVTVKGTMDAKALAETLKERLKRTVEIVPPKKEKDGEKDGDNGGGGKNKKGGGQDNGGGDGGGAKLEGNRMEFMVQPGFGQGYGYMGQPVYGPGYMPVYGNGYMMGGPPPPPPPQPMYGYGQEHGYGQVPGYPVHMKFNDENPNACSIM